MRMLGLLALGMLIGCPKASENKTEAARIASVTIDSDATLWALGEDVRADVVAVSALVDDERYSSIVGTWPQTIPRVKGTSESLIALQPTVVFVAEWSDPAGRALLQQADAEVIVLSGYGGFEDYRSRVRSIAAAAGDVAGGKALIAQFDADHEAVTTDVGAGKTVVSYASGNAAAAGTTFADEAEAAGLVNLPSREGLSGHPKIGLEQLVAWQPEVIVIPCENDCDATEAAFAHEPGISATPAAKHGRIIAIDPPLLFATGPRMLEVVGALAARLDEADP